MIVDRTPIMMGKDTPVEVVAELFGKVGCRYICIVEDGKGVGVVIKKRFLMFMEEMAQGRALKHLPYTRTYLMHIIKGSMIVIYANNGLPDRNCRKNVF